MTPLDLSNPLGPLDRWTNGINVNCPVDTVGFTKILSSQSLEALIHPVPDLAISGRKIGKLRQCCPSCVTHQSIEPVPKVVKCVGYLFAPASELQLPKSLKLPLDHLPHPSPSLNLQFLVGLLSIVSVFSQSVRIKAGKPNKSSL